MTPAIELHGVDYAYDGGPPVLRDACLTVEEGEFVAIAGPNGGGKTTLLRILLGLARPAAGTALLFGEPAHRFSRRATLGYLAQRSRLGTDAPATVREVVSAGRLAAGGLLGPLRAGDKAIVARAIADVGLEEKADAPLATLSGGQQQRAFIAQESLARLLERLHRERQVTVLYVSHEFGAVEKVVRRLVLVRGGIVFDGPPSDLPGAWHDPSHVHA